MLLSKDVVMFRVRYFVTLIIGVALLPPAFAGNIRSRNLLVNSLAIFGRSSTILIAPAVSGESYAVSLDSGRTIFA